jgi:hypothetical protein
MGKWTAKVRKSKPERQGFLAIFTEKRSKTIKKGLKPNDFGPNYIKMRLAKNYLFFHSFQVFPCFGINPDLLPFIYK